MLGYSGAMFRVEIHGDGKEMRRVTLHGSVLRSSPKRCYEVLALNRYGSSAFRVFTCS